MPNSLRASEFGYFFRRNPEDKTLMIEAKRFEIPGQKLARRRQSQGRYRSW
jgi:hypothetical protein